MSNLPKTMKALVAYSQTDYRLEKEYPTPECGPDDIIIKTEGCGICAGDLKCRHGAPSSVVQGLQMIRKLGTFVEFSVFSQETKVDWSIIGDRKELDIYGSHLSPYAYPFVIENITNGNLKTNGVVSRTFPIEEWEQAFEYATGKYGDYKVAIVF